MKYITLEELEKRKQILQDKIDKLQEKRKTIDITKDFIADTNIMNEISNIEIQKWEIEYLIDYIKMKCEEKETETTKLKFCVRCKNFIKCREYTKDNCLFMWGDFCARFEEGNIEENRKWFDKHLKENYNI